MKIELAPSILSMDFGQLGDGVRELASAGADWIHLDVMDGVFVPPITFGAQMARDLKRRVPEARFEAHLMTEAPDHQFDAFVAAGCERITFQAEATSHVHRLAQSLRDKGVMAGVAINPGTPVEAVEPLLDVVNLVLVMTVNPGWGGQKFIETALDKVRRLRSLAPQLEIQVDGGIDPTTLPLALQAGANVFVAGSYLLTKPTLTDGLEDLRRACVCAG